MNCPHLVPETFSVNSELHLQKAAWVRCDNGSCLCSMDSFHFQIQYVHTFLIMDDIVDPCGAAAFVFIDHFLEADAWNGANKLYRLSGNLLYIRHMTGALVGNHSVSLLPAVLEGE